MYLHLRKLVGLKLEYSPKTMSFLHYTQDGGTNANISLSFFNIVRVSNDLDGLDCLFQ